MKIGDRPSFFAIASAPFSQQDKNIFTFLIKDTPNNEFVVKKSGGDSVDMSVPMGLCNFRILNTY